MLPQRQNRPVESVQSPSRASTLPLFRSAVLGNFVFAFLFAFSFGCCEFVTILCASVGWRVVIIPFVRSIFELYPIHGLLSFGTSAYSTSRLVPS